MSIKQLQSITIRFTLLDIFFLTAIVGITLPLVVPRLHLLKDDALLHFFVRCGVAILIATGSSYLRFLLFRQKLSSFGPLLFTHSPDGSSTMAVAHRWTISIGVMAQFIPILMFLDNRSFIVDIILAIQCGVFIALILSLRYSRGFTVKLYRNGFVTRGKFHKWSALETVKMQIFDQKVLMILKFSEARLQCKQCVVLLPIESIAIVVQLLPPPKIQLPVSLVLNQANA